MLRFTLITIHPKFIESYQGFGVFRSAKTAAVASVEAIDLRDFAVDKHASVDGAPYGGGDGMVLRPEPLRDALNAIGEAHVILTSPSGKPFRQDDAARLATSTKPIALICGRFGGVDQRFIDLYVDEEFSIGDVVLSGGELPALMMVDATLRLLPGVLGNPESAANDSFTEAAGGLLEYPLYTRPPIFEDEPVPPVLLSGDHEKIAAWRRQAALERTRALRPDLLVSKKT